MYGLLALAALALAGLSEGTRLGLRSILDNSNAARHLVDEKMRSVKVEGDTVKMMKREGDMIEITDATLARDLHELSTTGPVFRKNKRTGFTQIKNLFTRDDGCGVSCGQGAGTCSTVNNGDGYCYCLKDCGPEGEECFSTCFPPAS